MTWRNAGITWGTALAGSSGAAVVQTNAGNTGTAAPTSVTVTLSTAASVSNQIVLCIASDALVSTPSGWTLDRSHVGNAGHYVFRKAGDGLTSWNIPTDAASSSWAIIELSGLAASPVAQVQSAGNSAGNVSQTTGTTATTSGAASGIALASWSTSKNGTSAIATIDAMSNSFTERADTSTTRTASGTNVGVSIGTKAVTADGTFESTATISDNSATSGIMVVYKAA